jgi:hypothetical protein
VAILMCSHSSQKATVLILRIYQHVCAIDVAYLVTVREGVPILNVCPSGWIRLTVINGRALRNVYPVPGWHGLASYENERISHLISGRAVLPISEARLECADLA